MGNCEGLLADRSLLTNGRTMKSQQSILVEVAKQIYLDACAELSTAPDDRDLQTLSRRVDREGISFLTITLPNLYDDVLSIIETGKIATSHFRSFKKVGVIPAFLQGIVGQIIDSETGGLKFNETGHMAENNKLSMALRSLAQICRGFKKIAIPCNPKRVGKALAKFIEIEASLDSYQVPVDDLFKKVSSFIWSNLVDCRCNDDSYRGRPKHGPGAVVEGLRSNQKWTFPAWYERLERSFPFLSMAVVNENFIEQLEAEGRTFIPEEHEHPVRIVTVPKNLKTPRIIGIEPSCMQYCQQAVSLWLKNIIENSPLTRGHINFVSQEVNKVLAMKSSIDRAYATLDLSSASDRVPLSGVQAMLWANEDLYQMVLDCRSTMAHVYNEDCRVRQTIKLKKYASMGSALTFVIEAMYFYTICVTALMKERELPVDGNSIRRCASDVYVYGDDIFVPTNEVESVVEYLHKYFCKVNTDKSFWRSYFRESCGMDAFSGRDVTPTYVRRVPPQQGDSQGIISWVKTAQAFAIRGMRFTAEYMYKHVESLGVQLPTVGIRCSGLGRLWMRDYRQPPGKFRYNKELFRLEKRCLVPTAVREKDPLTGHSALLKCLVGGGTIATRVGPLVTSSDFGPLRPVSESCEDPVHDHLSTSTRPYAVELKHKWVDAAI